jgi:hypothetical protein
MGLNTEDIKLITGLQSDMEGRLTTAIEGLGTGIRAKMESEVDRIDELDKLRNGKIGKCETEIETIKEQTKIARWIQQNKKFAAIILILFFFIVAYGYHTINFRKTIKEVTRIELNDVE